MAGRNGEKLLYTPPPHLPSLHFDLLCISRVFTQKRNRNKATQNVARSFEAGRDCCCHCCTVAVATDADVAALVALAVGFNRVAATSRVSSAAVAVAVALEDGNKGGGGAAPRNKLHQAPKLKTGIDDMQIDGSRKQLKIYIRIDTKQMQSDFSVNCFGFLILLICFLISLCACA